MYDMYQTIGGLNFRMLGKSFILGRGGGGVTPGNSWWGCAAQFSKS